LLHLIELDDLSSARGMLQQTKPSNRDKRGRIIASARQVPSSPDQDDLLLAQISNARFSGTARADVPTTTILSLHHTHSPRCDGVMDGGTRTHSAHEVEVEPPLSCGRHFVHDIVLARVIDHL
jgi:hypothetical protein